MNNEPILQAEESQLKAFDEHSDWIERESEPPTQAGGLNVPVNQIHRPKNTFSIQEIEARRFDPLRKVQELRVVYSLAGIPIATPGNLQAIAAQAKAAKSGFVNALLATPMAGPESDTLSLTGCNPSNFALVHFDTEQSPDDHWAQVDRASRRAGIKKLPPWCFSYCITGYAPKKAREFVQQVVGQHASECGGTHAILIDGAADLVTSVNDLVECTELVAELHALAIQYDCPVASVIHFNPANKSNQGYEKGRGHLGSQIERKAETNLRIDKKAEVSEVSSDKQRRAPIPKGQGPNYAWSDEKGMHVTVRPGQSPKDMADRVKAIELIGKVFKDASPMRRCDMESRFMDLTTKKESTASREVSKWDDLKLIEKTPEGLWTPTN